MCTCRWRTSAAFCIIVDGTCRLLYVCTYVPKRRHVASQLLKSMQVVVRTCTRKGSVYMRPTVTTNRKWPAVVAENSPNVTLKQKHIIKHTFKNESSCKFSIRKNSPVLEPRIPTFICIHNTGCSCEN